MLYAKREDCSLMVKPHSAAAALLAASGRGVRLALRDPGLFARGLYRRTYRLITDLAGDTRLGISTGMWKPVRGNNHLQQYGYEPAPYATLRDIRDHMRRHGVTGGAFADIGCGHGRPLYYFASLFDRLTGYEISLLTYQEAQAQLTHLQKRYPLYHRIRLVMEDATETLPLENAMVLFLYNPFGPEPMARFAERLAASGRELHIYYLNPLHAKVIEEALGKQGESFSTFMKVCYFHLAQAGS